MLNRRGDTDGFLKTALADGKHLRYGQKLVELDRTPEAVKHVKGHLAYADDTLLLAQQLRERGKVDEAIDVATHGLRLKGPRSALGRWLAPIAEARGDAALAVQAWTAVFHESPSLQLYKQIEALAGKQWPALKLDLLGHAKKTFFAEAIAEILLYEQDWDGAIALVQQRNDRSRAAAIVADGVVNHRPDWVITYSKNRADSLIATVSSSHYPEAVDWLARVKKAYMLSGQRTVWQAYFATLKELFKRRSALQKQLKRLEAGA